MERLALRPAVLAPGSGCGAHGGRVKEKRWRWKSWPVLLIPGISPVALLFIFIGDKVFFSFLDPLAQLVPGLRVGRLTSLLLGCIVPVVLVSVITAPLQAILTAKQVMVILARPGPPGGAYGPESTKHNFSEEM